MRYNQLNDKANEALGFLIALTDFTAPIIGSWIYNAVGMRAAFDIVAVLDVALLAILLIFNAGSNVFEEDKLFQ